LGEPRLAAIYDLVEGERRDLDHYLAIAAELGARSLLNVGCGTGTFACLAAGRGIDVAGWIPPRRRSTWPGASWGRTGPGGGTVTRPGPRSSRWTWSR
jgi:hypothetical protein